MENWTGFLRLAVGQRQGTTVPTEVYAKGAYKVTPPVYLDDSGEPCFYLIHLGGGYVDGDRYKAEIHLGEQAQMLLTTQSSTKIFKTLHRPASQETEIFLTHGSHLEYMPDPIIAYRDADYQQKTIVRMVRGSTVVLGDIITSGWSPDGGLFGYSRLQMKTMIYLDDELVVFDHLQFRPREQQMDGLGLLEGHSHFGSLFVIDERVSAEFLEYMSQTLAPSMNGTQIGLSRLTVPGFSLRVMASSTQAIETVLASCQRFMREQWLGKRAISLRKY